MLNLFDPAKTQLWLSFAQLSPSLLYSILYSILSYRIITDKPIINCKNLRKQTKSVANRKLIIWQKFAVFGDPALTLAQLALT